MKTNSRVILNIIILAALSVVMFAVIQLSQHGYDTPPLSEHLVVDMVPHNPDDQNIQDIKQHLNTMQQQLDHMDTRLHRLEQHTTSSHNHSSNTANNEYMSPTNVIYDNPLNNQQCRNALLDLDGTNIPQLINENTRHIRCHKRQNWKPSIWTREGIASLTNRECYRPHTPLRTTDAYIDIIKDNQSSIAKQNGQDVPVYYHMPKCASSSTAGMLQEQFGFKQLWVDGPETNHHAVHTSCGFTFIRNPIERFISGYYTVNNMLWRECKDDDGKKTFISHTNEKFGDDKYKFIRIIGEPQRFEMYLEEMFANSYHFGKQLPFRHTGTQMYFLSNWYGSDIQWFGRVEHYEKHWNELMEMESCQWFKENRKKANGEKKVPNAMYHYGWYGPTLWKKANGEKKEYIDALGMRKHLEKMHSGAVKDRVDSNDILAPAYYFITEKIYNRIVEYFWQDFVCFGYPTDYANFQKYVAQFVNPNEIE